MARIDLWTPYYCRGGTTDNNATYRSGSVVEDELVVALPLFEPPSWPFIVPPCCCAGWLLRGLRLMLLPPSNATVAAAAAAATTTAAAVVGPNLCWFPLAITSAFCPLPKKEAAAAAPPASQRQHQRQNVYKSAQLGLISPYLQYLKCVMLVKGISN
jgi:hypothetical protein